MLVKFFPKVREGRKLGRVNHTIDSRSQRAKKEKTNQCDSKEKRANSPLMVLDRLGAPSKKKEAEGLEILRALKARQDLDIARRMRFSEMRSREKALKRIRGGGGQKGETGEARKNDCEKFGRGLDSVEVSWGVAREITVHILSRKEGCRSKGIKRGEARHDARDGRGTFWGGLKTKKTQTNTPTSERQR